MRGIGYERIKRGVLLASVGATFLAPAAAAQACPPPWAPAWGYWQHGPGIVQHGNGPHSAGTDRPATGSAERRWRFRGPSSATSR